MIILGNNLNLLVLLRFMGLFSWIKLLYKKDSGHARQIVHLGNLGMDEGQKTRDYAKRFLNFRFIGIDTQEAPQDRPPNWDQIEAEFLVGLNKLEDACIDLISSELAVGHYGSMKKGKVKALKEVYTRKILQKAYKKLKPNGKVHIVVGDDTALRLVEDGLKRAGFRKIKLKGISRSQAMRTPYMRKYFEKPEEYLSSGLIEISAVK